MCHTLDGMWYSSMHSIMHHVLHDGSLHDVQRAMQHIMQHVVHNTTQQHGCGVCCMSVLILPHSICMELNIVDLDGPRCRALLG